MVKISSKKKYFEKKYDYEYDYPTKIMETLLIDKNIRDEISKFCKDRKIKKSRLIENFYKTILIRFRDGSLNVSSGYVTINIFS